MTILTEKFRFIKDNIFLCPWIDTEKKKVVKDDVFFYIQQIDNSGRVNQSDFYSCRHEKGKIVSPEEFKHYLKLKETQNFTFAQYYEKLLRNEYDQTKCDIEKLIQIDSEQEKYDIEYEYNILKKWIKKFADLDLECLSFISKVNRNIHDKPITSKIKFISEIRPYFNINLIISFLLKDNPKFILDYLEWAEKLHPNNEINLTEKIFPILNYLGDERNKKKYIHFEETIIKISNLKLTNKILILLLEHNPDDDLFKFIKKFKPDFVTSSLKMIRDELNFDDINNNAIVKKSIKLITNYAQNPRSNPKDKKIVFDYILELNLPIVVLKTLPNLVIFYLKNYPDYFSRLISKIKGEYEDIFDFFKQDMGYYLNILYSLKEKNKDLDELISKIPPKDYFLNNIALDSLLYDNPDKYKEISWILKTNIFDYLTPYCWGHEALRQILQREPNYIKEFMTELEKKSTFNGKRDEEKFLSKIEPLIDSIWISIENYMSNEDRLIIDEIMNFYSFSWDLTSKIDPKYKALFYPEDRGLLRI